MASSVVLGLARRFGGKGWWLGGVIGVVDVVGGPGERAPRHRALTPPKSSLYISWCGTN